MADINVGAITEALNDKADVDLNNTGLANLENDNGALKWEGKEVVAGSYATNCITRIPQDIKLELKDGELTLKAGSRLYQPNGSGVFNEIITQSDVTTQTIIQSDDKYMVFDNGAASGDSLRIEAVSRCYSGSTTPTNAGGWYDTENNLIKTGSGSTWTGSRTLPFAIVTIANKTITSIDQVFNGFGYIGSHVFVLPGLSVLTPNGRNADGTLNNRKYTFTACETYTRNISSSNVPLLVRYNGTIGLSTGITYDPITNKSIGADGYAQIGTVDLTSGVISNFTPKQVFHAVDYNEFNEHRIVDFQEPTSSNNYTWYRKYSDGWVEQGGILVGSGAAKTASFPVAFTDNKYVLFSLNHQNQTTAWSNRFGYNKTTTGFTWTSDNNVEVDWYACGYAA